ncbi:hypothetical protein ABOM_003494 [Aspergillus bombycis]|uniref:Xylanolytic transcriptional activator regulatory domain-containing protein n=1 Tax=Aspergillus bombycis TaxID=109264 RepID=A0A1F8ACP0_9EURO|nr:hypothetical protein ABOM_003494 [Aspergillus bombycis]OGM49421.1 hypothetical protein ABOM_003494 [Aspergillus bombycis]
MLKLRCLENGLCLPTACAPPPMSQCSSSFGDTPNGVKQSAFECPRPELCTRLWTPYHPGKAQSVFEQQILGPARGRAEFHDGLQLPPSDGVGIPETRSSPVNYPSSFFLFGPDYPVHLLRKFYPPAGKALLLWKFFQQNVSPLVPILHRPTASKLIRDAYESPDSQFQDSEALILVIYLAAVISMTEDQCLGNLGVCRATCIKNFRFAVEQALSRAGLLYTDSFILLQAAVLYVTCIRREDAPKFTFSMTSIIVRLAQGLGLHRDGTLFGLSLFETEMRRRLWWHIYILDLRASEDHGIVRQINSDMFDTHLPSNLNDEDIVPELDTIPQQNDGFTDVTFLRVRCEISVAFSHDAIHNVDATVTLSNTKLSSKDSFHQTRQYIDKKYLSKCNLSVPIQWVCATASRLILAKYWIMTRYALANSGSPSVSTCLDRSQLLVLSLKALKYSHLLENHVYTSGWAWLFRSYIQWHAASFILSELCVLPRSAMTDQAWAIVSVVFDTWRSDASQQSAMVWKSITQLKKRADTSVLQRLSTTAGANGGWRVPYNIQPNSPINAPELAMFDAPGLDTTLPDIDWLMDAIST